MKKIKLTQGQYALVDDEDFEDLNKYKWIAQYSSCTKTYYVKRHSHRECGKPKHLQMHRVIMNAKKGQVIDHINGNTLDNRKENLRIATYSQNRGNSKRYRNNTSGYKGVSWNKNRQRWEACIGYQNKYIYLGLYTTKEEAALAYNEAAKKYFGEFANLNYDDNLR